MGLALAQNLGDQVKVSDIVSKYPNNTEEGFMTQVGEISQGSAVNDTTTKKLSKVSFEQGQFLKAFSKVDFEHLIKTQDSNGDENWSYSKNINGNAHSVTMRKADILSSVTLDEVQSDVQIQEMATKYNIKKTDTYITVDGKKYFIRMNIPMHFGTGKNNDIIMDTAYFIVGTEAIGAAIAGVIAKLGIDAFATALVSINTQVFKVLWTAIWGVLQISYAFLQAFVGGIIGGETVAVAFAAGQAAVGTAIAEGAFAAITASALAYTVVGLLVVATIYLILTYALHYTYQNVYFYNMTNYDLDFDFGYIYEGNAHNVESKHLPAYQKKVGPNNIDMGSWYSATAFRFQSDSKFYGLGYSMLLNLKEKGTQTIKKQMACMFDIPYVGNNSLKASATLPANMKNFYTSNEGVVKKTQYAANDGELEIIVTYDYLSGTHNDPETGSSEYIYNSLVIVREKDPHFSINPSAELKNDGYLSIPDNAAYNFGTGDFTLEAWIKPTAQGTIFGKKSTAGGSSDYAGFLMVLQPNGAIKLATDNGMGYNQIMSVATNIFNGDWHHIASVRKGGVLSIYLNGEQINSTPSGSLAGPLNVSNNLPLLVGSVQQTQEPYIHYTGAISKARAWNKALSAEQIMQSLNVELTGNEPGLVGNWPLHNNGDDTSLTHNNATINGVVNFGTN